MPSTVAIPSRQARRDEQGHVLNFHNQGAQERAATQEMQGSVHYGCSMTDFDDTPHLSRRMLLAAAGMTAVSLIGSDAEAASGVRNAAESEPASLVHGLHLQFGADASSEIVVSWHALRPVRHARVALGRLDGTLVRKTDAQEASYTDAKSGKTVYAYHARIAGSDLPLRGRCGFMMDVEADGDTRDIRMGKPVSPSRIPMPRSLTR